MKPLLLIPALILPIFLLIQHYGHRPHPTEPLQPLTLNPETNQ
jgi:hypothetical protein